MTPEANPLAFGADMSRVDLLSVRQDYDDFHRREGGCDETERVVPVGLLIWTTCLRRICLDEA